MVGDIGIIHICPEAYSSRKILPHSLVFPHRFLAVVDKWFQTVLFNLFLAVQTQHFLHFQLYRKAVGIPSCLSRYHAAFHGAVSRNHIFDNTCQNMADVRLAIGCGRAVIESVGLTFFSVFHALFENFIVFPEFLDVFFSFHKIHVCGDFLIHVLFSFLCAWGDIYNKKASALQQDESLSYRLTTSYTYYHTRSL